MSETNSSLTCQLGCWLTAAVAALVATVVMIVVGNLNLSAAIFLGVLLLVGLGAILSWLLCRPLPSLAEVQARGPNSAAAHGTGQGTSHGAAKSPDHTAASPDDAEGPAVRTGAQSGKMSAATAAAAVSGAASKTIADSTMDADASGVPPIGASAASDERASAATHAPSEVPPIGAATASDAAGSRASGSTAGSITEDFDKDGVLEGANEGEKPPVLDGPRGGKPDDLKEIKGVGPKLEKMLNGKGIYHFDQIAEWSGQELAWVDANIEGFKGRASRDEWVQQARILAAGGQTEFSKRVDEGDVY